MPGSAWSVLALSIAVGAGAAIGRRSPCIHAARSERRWRRLCRRGAAAALSLRARAGLADVSDDFVAVLQPAFFQSVGQWYSDFTQVTDDEVAELLAASHPGSAD